MKVYYEHLTNNQKINNGRTTIKGTRIEPKHIVNYGTIDEIIEDFQLTRNQVIEALHYELVKQ